MNEGKINYVLHIIYFIKYILIKNPITSYFLISFEMKFVQMYKLKVERTSTYSLFYSFENMTNKIDTYLMLLRKFIFSLLVI